MSALSQFASKAKLCPHAKPDGTGPSRQAHGEAEMRQVAYGVAGLALRLGPMLRLTPASAQSNRTYVSAQGDDTNPCTAAAPCRTFQVAHDGTNSGGEIMVLNAGGYGP